MPRTAITTPRVVSRFMGGSTLFNGSTSTIVVPHNTNQLLTKGLTLSAWIKPNSIGDGAGRIIDKTAGTGAQDGFFWYLSANNSISFRVNGGSVRASGNNVIKYKNEWIHVLVSVESNANVIHYINGSASGTPGTTGALSGITTTNDLTIGNRSGATDATFDGRISEVKIFNSALTAAQALELYITGSVSGVTPVYSDPLDETGTTFTDTINGIVGTGTNTVYSPDTPIQQRKVVSDDKASLKFDGVDDYVNIPFTSSLTFDNIDPFTAQVVLKNTKLGLVQRILAQGLEILMRTTASNTYEAVFNSFSTNDRTSGGVVNLNKWDDVVMQFDGTKIKLFQDGKKVSEITPTGTYGGDTNAFAIGISAGEVLSSIVKSTRIWNTALTHQQIRDLHFNKIVPTTGLVGEWKLNEGAGTIAYDSSGNGNNGTITGATWSADTPSKAREAVGGNLVPNGFLTNVPPFVAETTNGGGIIIGQAGVGSQGVYGVSKSEQSKIFTWGINTYNVTNPRSRYVENAFLNGSNAIKMSFTDVKERVDLRLAHRQYPDLNDPGDIRLNCVPVLPNTSYTFSVKGKLSVSAKTGNPFGTGNGFYMYAYEHTPSGAVTMRKVTFLESDTNEITRSITFTTGANTRFINIGGGAYGNATDYWSGEVYVGKIYLNKTTPDTRTAV